MYDKKTFVYRFLLGVCDLLDMLYHKLLMRARNKCQTNTERPNTGNDYQV